MNYIGPAHGQGIRIYLNGVQRRSTETSYTYSNNPGDRRIVVGRYYTGDYYYGSVELDELMFFNTMLTEAEISMLSQF